MRSMPLCPFVPVTLLIAVGTSFASAAQWEMAPSMPAPKSNTFAITYQGDVYMVGGSPWRNGGDQDGSVFRLRNGTWSEVATLEGMGPAVGQGGGVDAQGRILFFGGLIAGSGDLAASRYYDPVDGTYGSPPAASAYLPPQNFGLAVDDQHRIYRLGGGCDASCNNNTSVSGRFDGATTAWENVQWLPYSRSSIAAAYDGQGHIWGFGGYTSFGLPRIYDTIRYTIATDTWETIGSLFLPVQTSDARACLGADGRVYMIGGLAGAYTGVPTTTVYVLDPSVPNPVLQVGPSLNVGRYDFGVTLGDDGYIYVIGGITANGATPTVERLYTGPETTIGDVDGDGDVDFADLLSLLASWGPCPAPPAACPADVDGTGAVDFNDLLVVLANWSS